MSAQEGDNVSPVVERDTSVKEIFESLEEEIKNNIPKGQEVVSYANNYQSMEPEPMTFYSGSGSTEVNNGLTLSTNGKTVAAWEKAPFLSSGIMEIEFQIDKTAPTTDLGVSLKSNSKNAGISIRYQSDDQWIIQHPDTGNNIWKGPVAEGSALTPNVNHIMKVGQHGDRLVIAINDILIYDNTDYIKATEQADILGQFGLYSRDGSANFKVKDVSITGVGTNEAPRTRYIEDYEETTTEDLNWVNASEAKVIDDGTGNKVLRIEAADKRVTDLNSPDIKNGTLSLRYKVDTYGQGFAFGFRHSDDSSVFSEIGIDGAGVWIPESSGGWGSNLGLPIPVQGIWNDLMFNFEDKTVTIYLNKELIGVRTFDKFTDAPGKFGLRLRNAILLIDDVIYTEEILSPESVKAYDNDFSDGITGTWSKEVSIIQDGSNGILQIPGSSDIVTLQDTADLNLGHGTLTTKIKTVEKDIKLQFGNAIIEWDGAKWVVSVDGVRSDFVGDLSTTPLVEKKWNNLAVKFSGNDITLSLNGKEAVATVEGSKYHVGFGIASSKAVYLDDFLYTEKLLEINTSALSDKFEYSEYYAVETDVDFEGLENEKIVKGRLEGTIAAGEVAIDKKIADTAHGVYQFRLKSDQTKLGFSIGNTRIVIDESGQWTAEDSLKSVKVIGKTDAYVANQELIVRVEIIEGTLTLSVNGKLVNSIELENYVGGKVGIYNPNGTPLALSLDAIAVEELRVYEADYSNSKWEALEGSASITNNPENVVVNLPGVSKAVDKNSPKVLDQFVSFDFATNVDASASGGRYGFMLKTANDKEFVTIEHDINGIWRANYRGDEFKFGKTFSLNANTTYRMDASIVGSIVSFKITEQGQEAFDLGSVDIKEISAAGQFGLRSWYSGKNITISNLKIVESSTLAPWYLDALTNTIENDGLSIVIDEDFPRIVSYEYNGKTIAGQKNTVKTVLINGTQYEPNVISEESTDGTEQAYTLTIDEINVVIKMTIKVEDDQVVSVKVTSIEEKGDFLVRTFSLGENTILYTDTSKEGSSYAQSSSSGQWHGVSEELVDNTKDMAKGGRIGTTLSMVSESGLAASLENNVMSGGNKIIMNKELKPLIAKVSLNNGTWTYRHNDQNSTEELPWFKVVIGEDQNNDGVVNWQDAAVLYRERIYTKNFESEDIANNMMYIAFNFASQANDPFLNSLENGKVLYNYTDGFGQMVLHKGYQAEGHDDDIPSYSNIGVRQGGEEDFKKLIEEGKKYNMNIGVHLNATEYHLDANELVYDNLSKNANGGLLGGWDWIDDSYYVDQTKDVISRELQERFKSLTETAPGLDFFYIDVYTGNDYNAYKLLQFANELGIKIGTEFSGPIEPGANFVHWGPDLDYPNKGNSSLLSRMVKNDQDIFVGHSLFKGQKIPGVTTWGDTKPDMQRGVTVFYNDVLPTKYMQHFGVMKVEDDVITFDDGVVSQRNGKGMVELTKDGKLISTWKDHGTTKDEGQRHTAESLSLIPWVWDTSDNTVLNSDNGAKLYHWNPNGGTSTWELTDEFKDAKSLTLYELTQNGKREVEILEVIDGKVTLNVEKNTPYVLYKTGSKVLESAGDWGEGSPVKDFAFNSESIGGADDVWETEGKASVETVEGNTTYLAPTGNLSRWNKYVNLGAKSNISQVLDAADFEEGQDYTVSVWAQVEPGQKAVLELELDGKVYSNYVSGQDKSHQSSFKYVNTNYQRLSVKFNVPVGLENASIKISAVNETGSILLDDVKVWKHLSVDPKLNSEDYVVYEDFENVSEGWGPFEYIRGSRKTHIASDRSNKNDNNAVVEKDSGEKGPVMTWVLEGENSLKLSESELGQGIKTNEDRVKLEPNTKYNVSFDYTMNEKIKYEVLVQSRATGHNVGKWDLVQKINSGKSGKTEADYNTFNETFTTGNADDYQVIIRVTNVVTGGASSLKTFIIDRFIIKEEFASFTDFETLLSELKLIEKDAYTTSSWRNLQNVIKEVEEKITEASSPREIKDAINRLNSAKEGLTKIVGIEELKEAIVAAEAIDKKGYSTATWNTLQDALVEAEKVASEKETNESISNANHSLRSAIDGLVKVDKLEAAIVKMEAIKKGNYTSESYDALQASIALSKEIVKTATSSDQVTSQITLLNNAKANLVEKGSVEELTEVVESLPEIDPTLYTEESVKRYNDALALAKEMLANNDASQAEIDVMIESLQKVLDDLVDLYYRNEDAKTGVVVEWMYGVLEPGSEFKISKLKDKSNEIEFVKGIYGKELTNLFGYSISVDGAVQPNGKVKISIPLPEGFDKTNLVLIDVVDGGANKIESFTIVDNMLVFEVSKLGTFVIGSVATDNPVDVTPVDPSNPENNGNADLPTTGMGSSTSVWVSVIILGIGLIALMQVKKKREN